jgi:hypothetical protein
MPLGLDVSGRASSRWFAGSEKFCATHDRICGRRAPAFGEGVQKNKMPKIMVSNDNNTPWYYNVSYGVGSGGVNQKLDVMMVQYMLAKIASVYTWGKHFKAPQVSGKCDSATIAAIKGFQTAYNGNFGTGLLKNGLVSPAKRESDLYTIWAINQIFKFFFEDTFYDPWYEGGDMPMELRTAMYHVWISGSQYTVSMSAA